MTTIVAEGQGYMYCMTYDHIHPPIPFPCFRPKNQVEN